jgi:hypothetical protein
MLPLPFPPTDVLALADWMEIVSMSRRNRQCSVRDLGRQLKKSSVLTDDNIEPEEAAADIITELRTRAKAAANSYPFAIDGTHVRLKSQFENFLPYTFCLCLSYFGGDRRPKSPLFPRRAFEEISSIAAGNYLLGEGIRFGAPRRGLPAKFDDALNKLCYLMGEGRGFRGRGFRMGQDDTLDVVAWRDSPDKRLGKLLMFGQCASGDDWKDKTQELQPAVFCRTWLMDEPISHLRAFFIPHRIKDSDWHATSIRAGILFDRCRVSYWAQRRGDIPDSNECVRWCRWQLLKATK